MNAPARLAALLGTGDRRVVGTANQLAAQLTSNTRLINSTVKLLNHPDAGIRMRAADALEKFSRHNATRLQKHLPALLALASSPQQEVQWHFCQILPRLDLSPAQRRRVRQCFLDWLDNAPSRIVRVCALQGLAELYQPNRQWSSAYLLLLEKCAHEQSPALRARARRLLKRTTGRGKPA